MKTELSLEEISVVREKAATLDPVSLKSRTRTETDFEYCKGRIISGTNGVIFIDASSDQARNKNRRIVVQILTPWNHLTTATWDHIRSGHYTGLVRKDGKCNQCGQPRGVSKNGIIKAWCNACDNRKSLCKKFDLTMEELNWLYSQYEWPDGQSHCALTGKAVSGSQRHIDHNHDSWYTGCNHAKKRQTGCKNCIRGILYVYVNNRILPAIEKHASLQNALIKGYIVGQVFKGTAVRISENGKDVVSIPAYSPA